MKKKKLKNLNLNKKPISNLQKISGGDGFEGAGDFTGFFICTNAPTQAGTCSPYCHSIELGATCGCVSQNNEHSCNCTIA